MFACLYLPPPANASSIVDRRSSIVEIARDFSPRVETYGERAVTLDISGLDSLIGAPRAIGEELRRVAADAGLRVHIAVAATSTAALLVAHARAGLMVVARGEEAKALAPLPLDLLDLLAHAAASAFAAARLRRDKPNASPFALRASGDKPIAPELKRWGLKTLGDLASLPSSELSARLGQDGIRWQKWARGEEMRPLVPAGIAEQFEESLDLEWPIEGLEPLSFVLARLLDPLCDRLERRDRGAVVLRVTLKLVTRELHERVVELPAPMRDARMLRTLALLDLESNPPSDAIDRVTVGVDVAEGRILQFGLFARALPSDTLATLMARLGALMGTDRVGSPALVDTYRPGAFVMATFDPSRASLIPYPRLCSPDCIALRRGSPKPSAEAAQSLTPNHTQGTSVLRRFRSPIPARVEVEQGRPVRVTTDRRGFSGGRVERSEGPWRSSGDWWRRPWNCDEWDVALRDGTTYRVSHAHDSDAWFMEGLID